MIHWLLGLFGSGAVPADARTVLEKETILFLEDELQLSTTYIGYRAPGKFFGWKRKWSRGSLVLTTQRLVGFVWNSKQIDLPFQDPHFDLARFSIEGTDTFCIC